MSFIGKAGFIREDNGKLIFKSLQVHQEPRKLLGSFDFDRLRASGASGGHRGFQGGGQLHCQQCHILPMLFGGVGGGCLLFEVASEDQKHSDGAETLVELSSKCRHLRCYT